jgi:hypothetical protein
VNKKYSIIKGPKKATIILNGKKLKSEKEILNFIDTLKPVDFYSIPNPELEWDYVRASYIFQFLYNQKDRDKIISGSKGTMVGLTAKIYRHVKKRYPNLGWSTS